MARTLERPPIHPLPRHLAQRQTLARRTTPSTKKTFRHLTHENLPPLQHPQTQITLLPALLLLPTPTLHLLHTTTLKLPQATPRTTTRLLPPLTLDKYLKISYPI